MFSKCTNKFSPPSENFFEHSHTQAEILRIYRNVIAKELFRSTLIVATLHTADGAFLYNYIVTSEADA